MLESLNKVIMLGKVATPLKEIPNENIKRMGMAVDTSGMLHHVVISGDFCEKAGDMFDVGCVVYLEGRIASYPYEAEDGTKSVVVAIFATSIDKVADAPVADAPKPKKTTRKKKVAKKVAE